MRKILKTPIETCIVEQPFPLLPKKLSQDHLKKIELMGAEVRIAKLEMAIEEQFLQNLMLQYSMLQMKIEKQKILNASKQEAKKIKEESRTNFIKEIGKVYGFSEEFSYNPETGEIL